jgi:hypothetical protein
VNGLRELAGFESDSAESQRPFGVLGLGRSFAARVEPRAGLAVSEWPVDIK